MPPPAQPLAVAAILLSCLALVSAGALAAPTAAPAATTGPADLARRASLPPTPPGPDEAARRQALAGDPGSRETRIRARAGAAPGALVPEGLAPLFRGGAWPPPVPFVSTTPRSHPARRALERESRRWRCVR